MTGGQPRTPAERWRHILAPGQISRMFSNTYLSPSVFIGTGGWLIVHAESAGDAFK